VFDLIGLEAGDGMERESCFLEAGEEFFLKEAFLVFFEAADSLFDGGKLPADIESGGVPQGGSRFFKGVKAADADLEKLIKVGAGNGKELDAVEKGQIGTQGFVENALVEFEPGEFTIEVGRLHEVGRD
jgi:hypothetical protein